MDITAKIDRILMEKDWGEVSSGVLEVPEGKSVQDLPKAHFVALAKSKGKGTVVRALLNLYRWNKTKNPDLSSWAKNMQEAISAIGGD